MKKGIILSLIFVSTWSFLACTRTEKEIPLPVVSFNENIEAGFESINLSCAIKGNVTVEKVTMEYSTDSSMGKVEKKYLDKGNGDVFTITLSGLESKTTYYYQYTITNKFGPFSDKTIRIFETSEYEEPVFSALEVSEILSQSAKATITISREGSLPITERGFCYSTTENPSVSDKKITFSLSGNTYSGTLSSLHPSTMYYVRAYAKNARGTYYSSQKVFYTIAGSIAFGEPIITDIQPQSATATITIEDTGGSTVTERGFCYSTSASPTVSDKKVTVTSSSNTYSGTLTSLSPSTRYYVRAYAKNSSGTYYSAQKEFTTSSNDIMFDVPIISNIQPQSATATATIKDAGVSTITERGFCYATIANPTVSHNKVTVASSSSTYSGTLTSLSPSTRYYVRAYAINSSGTYYSAQKVFTTSEEEYVMFEDEEFKKYCLQSFDKNGDGKITYSEAEAVTTIDVCTDNIYSLGGIECFKNVTILKARGSGARYSSVRGEGYAGNTEGLSTPSEGTSCAKGKLSHVDLSELTQLGRVDISFNNVVSEFIIPACVFEVCSSYCNLKKIEISHLVLLRILDVACNQVSMLKTSKNTKLTSLRCSFNQLTQLDVSKNTQLTDLSCGYNSLTQLDVSKNTQLTDLSCGYNSLTQLDVSKNTQLTDLSCDDNSLTQFDVSKNTQLTSLLCGGNQLTALDVSKNTQLKSLWCEGNQLTALDVSKNTQLTSLYCDHNQLVQLDVSNNKYLNFLSCMNNPGLTTVWLSYSQVIESFYYDSFTTIRYK